MDINLNFSANIISDFQGNFSDISVDAKEGMFEGIFGSLKNSKEDSDDIDYNMLLNLLSNLQILNSQETNQGNININDLNTIYDGVKNRSENLQNINDVLPELIKNSDESNKSLDKLILDSELETTELTSDEIELIKNLKESLSSKNLDENNRLDFITEDVDSSLNNKDSLNIEEEIDISSKKYNELEVSSLGNKNNLLQKSNTDVVDKDLDALENILNGDDNKNFIFTNNINFNSEMSSTTKVDNQVVTDIRQEFVGEDIVRTVKYLSSNGLEEITVKISPRELGDMTIKLVKNLDETKVSIIISKEDIFNQVNENIGEITKHLKDLNINLKDISVDIKTDSQRYFSDNLNKEFDKKNQQNQEKQQRKYKVKKSMLESIEETEGSKLEEDNLNILI